MPIANKTIEIYFTQPMYQSIAHNNAERRAFDPHIKCCKFITLIIICLAWLSLTLCICIYVHSRNRRRNDVVCNTQQWLATESVLHMWFTVLLWLFWHIELLHAIALNSRLDIHSAHSQSLLRIYSYNRHCIAFQQRAERASSSFCSLAHYAISIYIWNACKWRDGISEF